ncbi:MAG: hypothetical protein HQL09_05615 [Nitrospirae bacterium]|nr:hypothetical protein [Nitrospirota bacterium]
MNLLKILYIIGIFFLAGCSTMQSSGTHAPSVSMQKYSTIAVAKFVSPVPAVGDRVAARLVIRLAADGYTVANLENLKKLSGIEILTSPELTPADKAVMAANGINAVLYGTIDRYECKTLKEWTWTGFAPEKTENELCHASLSVKIVDAATGDTVWQSKEDYSHKDIDMTARMALERVLTRIEDEIPKINN